MIIVRLNTRDNDFLSLINKLDNELNQRYGILQSEYDKHNLIEPLETAVVGYLDKKPVACGCFKVVDNKTVEVKRMYVHKNFRRKGFSLRILEYLELWATESGCTETVLETGKGQPEAIGLYKKCGYFVIENYGPYKRIENSICMKKEFQI